MNDEANLQRHRVIDGLRNPDEWHQPSVPASGSASWNVSEVHSIRVAEWSPEYGVTYRVIKEREWYVPYVTTGTRYKVTQPLGDDGMSSLEESAARYACELHWRNGQAEAREP